MKHAMFDIEFPLAVGEEHVFEIGETICRVVHPRGFWSGKHAQTVNFHWSWPDQWWTDRKTGERRRAFNHTAMTVIFPTHPERGADAVALNEGEIRRLLRAEGR